jgi:hypothetical protein
LNLKAVVVVDETLRPLQIIHVIAKASVPLFIPPWNPSIHLRALFRVTAQLRRRA